MDYEKEYKKKLEDAKYWHDCSEGDIPAILEEIFSELKESNNEEIRKAISYAIANSTHENGILINGVTESEAIAWLEKQGKYKFEHGDDNATKVFKNEDGTHSNISQLERVTKKVTETEETAKEFLKSAEIINENGELAEEYRLEKQCTKRKQLYVRFGDIPSNEKSKIYRGEEEIGDENGVSVYPAFELNGNVVLGLTLPITRTTLYTQQHLLEYDNRPCYLVSGDYVGRGTDGEPLIRNISIIKRLDNYRIKELEKGGEQKPIIEMKSQEESLGISSEECNDIIDECLYGESNSVDKVEQRFKVGDWVVSDKGDTVQIGAVNNGYYTMYNGMDFNMCYVDNCWHRWTINDAKEGDVLVTDNGLAFIYNGYLEEQQWPFAYGGINIYGRFNTCYGLLPFTHQKVVPATKEQCDLLFQKMKESGYVWNDEKKELKLLITNGGDFFESENCEQNPNAWSEDDEEMFDAVLADIRFTQKTHNHEVNQVVYEKEIDWLKSLKERMKGE